MVRATKTMALGILALAAWSHQPAIAEDCEVISATHSAATKGEALLMARALAAKGASELSHNKGWRRFSMRPQKVEPDPFFKKVRPVVPEGAIYGTFVSTKTYTTCWSGVRVPYVCTSGSKVCRN